MNALLPIRRKTKRHERRHPPKPTGGFTMIELLVGIVIAFLIITPMLAFVVNILDNDVKEQAKTNTEQDLQTAIDYIAQDMSQAVYIYDPSYAGDVANGIPNYETFATQLPHSGDANKTPILVFWKREFVENALDPSGDICASSDCDDTFVLSLVAYYLVDDSSATWCQPSGSPCPKRIARFQIQDGVKALSGDYVCDGDGDGDGRSAECDTDALRKFQRDLGFSSFDKDNPTAWTKKSDETSDDFITLVNYIEGFDNSVNDNKLANITIVGNALRRSQNDFSCEDTSATPPYKDSPYCPKTTAQVGARSGYGTSE